MKSLHLILCYIHLVLFSPSTDNSCFFFVSLYFIMQTKADQKYTYLSFLLSYLDNSVLNIYLVKIISWRPFHSDSYRNSLFYEHLKYLIFLYHKTLLSKSNTNLILFPVSCYILVLVIFG